MKCSFEILRKRSLEQSGLREKEKWHVSMALKYLFQKGMRLGWCGEKPLGYLLSTKNNMVWSEWWCCVKWKMTGKHFHAAVNGHYIIKDSEHPFPKCHLYLEKWRPPRSPLTRTECNKIAVQYMFLQKLAVSTHKNMTKISAIVCTVQLLHK